MDGDFDEELGALATSLAAHLRFELDMANPYLPAVEAPEPVAQATPAPVADARAEPAPEAASPAAAASPDVAGSLEVIANEAASCTKCGLHEGRTKSVFARGNPGASLMFVGEGPGYHEDQSGLPFVGKAGKLLDRMIGAMGFGQDEIYVCNVVKCRPPENRTPTPDEAAACIGYLEKQVQLVKPRVIVALGRHAANNLGVGDGRWRGRWGTYEGIDVMPTYHPAYLLRSPEQKRPVWQDLQAVVARMGRELPSR